MPHPASALTGACPLCHGRERSLFIRHKGQDLYRCAQCDLVYLDPLPDAATLAAMYSDPYAGATESYFTKVKKKMRRSRGRVRIIKRYLARPAAGMRFLDAGCNGGFMAEAAREAGFASTGLDPDASAVAYARAHYPGNRFFNTLLEDAVLDEHSFDVIYSSEVIEHVPDCHRFVGALARFMRPGGLLYLTTPDISHWRRPRDVTKWDAFCPPSHCLYFSPANLSRLLAEHGFRVLRRRWGLKPGIKLLARYDGAAAAEG